MNNIEDDRQDLISKYLSSQSDYWRNVQEPSRRVKDLNLLIKLALLSREVFEDKLIRASSLVNLLYRTTETSLFDQRQIDDIYRDAEIFQGALAPSEGFADCRWYLSLILARSAHLVHVKNNILALDVLREADSLTDIAYAHGQLFTNIVKITLLRIILSSLTPKYGDLSAELLGRADAILDHSEIVARHYRFSNEWAYEEVSYVYAMMRQIYNWRRLISNGPMALGDLEGAGFNWQCIGNPFKSLIKNQI